MKFKKFLIIILSVALLSCFAVSTFATDATTAATIPDYGFYISPGDYVISETPTTFENLPGIVFNFRFTSYPNSTIYYGFYRGVDNSYVFSYLSSLDPIEYVTVFASGSWFNDNYRYITVLDGFYIYDINYYQWWMSNVSRVDSGYDSNLLDGILSSFTFIGEWIFGAANAVTPMFWDGEALTVVGTLSVAGLSFAVVFLLIALVSSFMKFRS